MESTKDNKRELLPVCPICNQFPLVTANIDEPGYINIKCNCGYEREKTSLKDYVSSILNNPKIEKEKIKRQCEEHKQPFKSYSPFFDQQLCNECNTSSIYLNDPQISLETDKLFIDRKIQKFQDNINRARTLFETNITKLKNRYIAKLVKEINAVNAAYDEARDNNFIFLDLCESLIKNYSSEQPNYYLNKSIVSNYFDFTYKDFTSEWNTESVIKYFKTLFFLDTKITYDKIKEEKTINVDNVNCLLLLKDGRITSCSGDKMIRIFNRKTYQCEETLEGHTNAVYSISQLDNGDIISCSGDKSIKIWSIHNDTYKCIQTMRDAHSPVTKAIQISKERIASCGYDKLIKIWSDHRDYHPIKTLLCQEGGVNSIVELKDKDLLVSGTKKVIALWNLTSYECEKKIEAECYWNNSVERIDTNRLIVGGEGKFSIVNIEEGTVENSFRNEQFGIIYSFMILRNGNVFFSTKEGYAYQYKVECKKYYKEFKPHNNYIMCFLKLNNHQFITGSADNTLKVWNY